MNKINTVAVVGGTHGNEFSGIYLLRKWQKNAQLISRSSFSTQTVFANPKAHEENRRYSDCDLNRQFSLADLDDQKLANYEQSRAKVINNQLGPKGNAKTDFIIDLHNTT
ncbi:succinylglutamate desuccinylase/aspartoacylase family protein, partial [Pseudomonadota bacterium]